MPVLRKTGTLAPLEGKGKGKGKIYPRTGHEGPEE
jgi:hypothetical protein